MKCSPSSASSRGGRAQLAAIETRERETTASPASRSAQPGVRLLHRGPEVAPRLVPHRYVPQQTLANAERYVTRSCKEYEAKVLGAEERDAELEFELFDALRGRWRARRPLLRHRASGRPPRRAGCARRRRPGAGYVRPVVDELDGARDPRGPPSGGRADATGAGPFVPNDTRSQPGPRRRGHAACLSPAPTWPASPPTCARSR